MNLNEMQHVWNSPRNNLPTETQQRLADQFSRQMVRRRNFQGVWLLNTFAWLTVITAGAIGMMTVDQRMAREWALLPLLILPWGFAIHFLRRYLKPTTPVAPGEMAIVDSLRVALESNRETGSHLKLVGVLYVIMTPLIALAIRQLHAVGKVSDCELTSMALFFGTVLLAGAGGISIRYFKCLQPQQKRLNALLGELAGES